MKKIGYILIMLLLLSSCKTIKYVEVPVETVKVEYINKYDSIYVKDSVFHEIKTIKDTVFDIKNVYHKLIETRVDTFKSIDTIPVIIKEEIPVEVNKIKGYQKVLMYGGGFLFLLLLILFIIGLIKIIKYIKKIWI